MTETPNDVIRALREFLRVSTSAAQVCMAGLPGFAAMMSSRMTGSATNEDPSLIFGVGDPNSPDARSITSLRVSEINAFAEAGGIAHLWLAQQWIVSTYTGWEHEYRPRLALAHNCDKSELRYELLGDLRLMRDDVVHHHGIATFRNTGKCRGFGRRFPIGIPIALKGGDFADFFAAFPFTEMLADPARDFQ